MRLPILGAGALLVLALGLAAGTDHAAPGLPAGQAPSSKAGRARDELPRELVIGGRVIGKQVEPRPGETCLVCNLPLDKDDVAYLVNGQRLAVHRKTCYDKLLSDPWRFLALLRPQGAFLGAGLEARGLSPAWFLLGLYVLTGLLFAALCAHRALHAGHNPAAWFGVGLAINLVGYLWLLTKPMKDVHAPEGIPGGLAKIPATYSPEVCPACGKANHPSAHACASCGAQLRPAIPSEVEKAGLRR